MNPRVVAAALIVLAVGIGTALFVSQNNDDEVIPKPAPTATPAGQASPDQAADRPAITVVLTEEGFSPTTVTVDAGGPVEFRNASGRPAIVASDPHPQHTGLSGLESDTLSDGESYTFTFERFGTFGIHNHLNPSQTAEVIVR
ncbi:MAG: cupredoxin domain-containing protein [Patescibacteria group bacterium]